MSTTTVNSFSTAAGGGNDQKPPSERPLGLPPALTLTVTPRSDIIGTKTNQSTTQACINILAKELEDNEDERAAVDIVVALDVSGSMSGDKLELCKKTLELLLRVLGSNDNFSLVSYASEALVEIPAQKMTSENKKACLKKIQSLYCRDCTCISDAIDLAAREMAGIENANPVRSIFLLTDGQANEGVCDVDGLVQVTERCLGLKVPSPSEGEPPSPTEEPAQKPSLVRRLRRSLRASSRSSRAESVRSKPISDFKCAFKADSPPVSMHCFGYGSDHNETLLRRIANATQGGTYYFVDCDSNVGTAFGDALGGVLSVVAQSAVVTIQVPQEALDRGVGIEHVYHDQMLKRENGTYTVTVGDFYAEESRDILFEIKLGEAPTGGGSNEPVPHAFVSLVYTDTIMKKPVSNEAVACSIQRPLNSDRSESHPHVLVQWLRVMATKQMAEAEERGRNDDLQGARDCIQKALDELDGSVAAVRDHPLVVQLKQDLGTALEGFSTSEQFFNEGQRYVQTRMQTHMMQRCSEASPSYGNYYRSKKKAAMSSGFRFSSSG